jgi:hypothetical protein
MSISASLKTMQSWRLFLRREEVRTSFEVVKWWEARRLPYNVIVGGTGIFTSAVGVLLCYVASRMTPAPFAFPNPPLFVAFAVVVYGVMANVCFTGGWLAELLARKVWRERANNFAQISFSLGLLFSVLLTLFPAMFLTVVLIYRSIIPEHS